MLQKVAIISGLCLTKILHTNGHCVDIHHQIVSQGLHYVPGPNSCTLCICDKGGPKWCKSVLCSQPQNCKSFQRGNSCCEFKCLDDILTANDTYKDTYDLALRLIASAVFVILTLSLLFFVIHRFRRHKLRVRQNRQLSEDQRSLNSIGYITGSIGYLPGSIGYLGSGNNDLEFQYEESNTHFSLWKPPGNYFPRGEAPPPYEEAIRSAHIESNIVVSQTVTTHNTANAAVQSYQARPVQVSASSMQCRHQHLTNRSTNGQEYANVTVETVRAEHAAKTEKTSSRNVLAHDKSGKSCASAEKSKSYENIVVNRKVERPMPTSNSEQRTAKQKPQPVVEYERSNIDKNNFKYHKYENVILRNSTAKETHRKVDRPHIDVNETCYENINPGYENVRHRTIPILPEYQSKVTSRIKESKSKDSVYLLPEAKQDLDKSHIGERSESNLKSLVKERKELPSHRTLPKNLKELTVSVSSNNEYIPSEMLKQREAESFTHKSLPKQLSNHDAVLSVNLVKSQINLPESFMKDISPSKSADLACPSSSHAGLFEYKSDNKPKAKDDRRSFISYQCLSSSQDEDDYRSECENCKSLEIINVEDEEGDVFNETMTLQRRPETSEEVPYYRTSLTLPTQIRKPRAVTPNPSRSGWFMAMQETSSSEESE